MVKFLSAAFCALVATGLVSASAWMPQTQTVLPHILEGWGYTDCGLPTDPVQISQVSVSPDPPKPGKDLTVTIAGDIQERIEDGATVDVTVKLGLIKILRKTFDVCEELRTHNVSVQCPVEKGPFTLTQTFTLPKEIPQAKFNIDALGYTASEDDMFCTKIIVDFMKNPF